MYINEEIDQYIAENPSYIKKIYDQKEKSKALTARKKERRRHTKANQDISKMARS